MINGAHQSIVEPVLECCYPGMGKGYAVPILLMYHLMGTLGFGFLRRSTDYIHVVVRFAHPTFLHTRSKLREIKPKGINIA